MIAPRERIIFVQRLESRILQAKKGGALMRHLCLIVLESADAIAYRISARNWTVSRTRWMSNESNRLDVRDYSAFCEERS